MFAEVNSRDMKTAPKNEEVVEKPALPSRFSVELKSDPLISCRSRIKFLEYFDPSCIMCTLLLFDYAE